MQLLNPDLEISNYKLYSINQHLFVVTKQGLRKLDMRTVSAVYWEPNDYCGYPTGEYKVDLPIDGYRFITQNETDAITLFNFIQSLMLKGASDDLTLVQRSQSY